MSFINYIEMELKKCNEKVLWKNQPEKGFHFESADIFIVPMSILFFGFVTYNFFTDNYISKIVLIPFAIFACYLLWGRFIVKAKMNRNIWFIITEMQIIALCNTKKRKYCSVKYEEIESCIAYKNRKEYGNLQLVLNEDKNKILFSHPPINVGIDTRNPVRRDILFGLKNVDEIATIVRSRIQNTVESGK